MHKPKKRDIEWSEKNLKEMMKKHRLNSLYGEIEKEEYIKINNTHLSAKEVLIVKYLNVVTFLLSKHSPTNYIYYLC
ncbi:hypothetical protein COD67_17740 [Bacillus cereus]|nr:hypothetical protein COI89_06195 [Bacillus cereus]PGU64903.1 hypothetical protein COD67_17740 [Bacillus cereus]